MRKIALNLLAITFIFASTGFAFDDGDVQFWNTDVIAGSLTDTIKVDAEQEYRWGDDISDFYYIHSQLQIHFKINDWLSVAPAYRQVFEEKSGEWTNEYRPLLNATVKCKHNGWELKNRSRIEFRNKENSEDKIRFRHKVTLKLPVEWTEYSIRPFVADEIFVEEDDGLNRNRAYVGLGAKLTDTIGSTVYYVWQSSDKGDWVDVHAIGLKFKLSF